jgi:phage tail-like protein
MAQSAAYQRFRYPLPVYNFKVTVGELMINFTEISGISVEYDHVTYRHGLSFLEGESIQTFSRSAFRPMTCKRGTILRPRPLFLHTWLTSRELRPMEISLCDENGLPVLMWKIAAAVPTSLKAPTFSAQSNDVSIDTLELQAKGVSFVRL